MPVGDLYLLDTNVLVAYIRAGSLGQWIESNYQLLKARDRPVVSVVSEGEISSLAKGFRWGEAKLEKLRELLGDLVVLDIHRREIIQEYAEVDHYSRTVGHAMGKNDVWIAATARAASLPILTTDKDFDHLHPRWLLREWIDESVVKSGG